MFVQVFPCRPGTGLSLTSGAGLSLQSGFGRRPYIWSHHILCQTRKHHRHLLDWSSLVEIPCTHSSQLSYSESQSASPGSPRGPGPGNDIPLQVHTRRGDPHPVWPSIVPVPPLISPAAPLFPLYSIPPKLCFWPVQNFLESFVFCTFPKLLLSARPKFVGERFVVFGC